MQVRWVPYSAGLLATGALAMLCGAILTPTGDAGESLTVVEENDGRYLLVALMLLLASVLPDAGSAGGVHLAAR